MWLLGDGTEAPGSVQMLLQQRLPTGCCSVTCCVWPLGCFCPFEDLHDILLLYAAVRGPTVPQWGASGLGVSVWS